MGGSEEARKIHWINWENVYSSKEYGGLGVRRIREFNLALLGKWCWHLYDNQGGLWFKVLVAKNRIEGGRVRRRGRLSFLRWRDLCDIFESEGGSGASWFNMR
jgi:hypothetical protein